MEEEGNRDRGKKEKKRRGNNKSNTKVARLFGNRRWRWERKRWRKRKRR